MKPILYGKAESVYVRAVRLTLIEKGVPYDLVEVDVFARSGVPAEHIRRHPFGRIPAFKHGEFALYESGAIARYVDETFAGPVLQPRGTRARARMNQALSVLDAYCYRTMVWDIFVEHVRAPSQGWATDQARVAAAWPRVETCMVALQDIQGDGPYFAGPDISLADLFAAPIFAYFRQVPEAVRRMGAYTELVTWWALMEPRPSMRATRSALG